MSKNYVVVYQLYCSKCRKMFSRENRDGITLVELLVVVLILAVLAAIAIPRISQSSHTIKANACFTNIDVLNSAIERYIAETNSYPKDLTEVSENTNYFPRGAPVCPVTNSKYPDELIPGYRVDASGHSH